MGDAKVEFDVNEMSSANESKRGINIGPRSKLVTARIAEVTPPRDAIIVIFSRFGFNGCSSNVKVDALWATFSDLGGIDPSHYKSILPLPTHELDIELKPFFIEKFRGHNLSSFNEYFKTIYDDDVKHLILPEETVKILDDKHKRSAFHQNIQHIRSKNLKTVAFAYKLVDYPTFECDNSLILIGQIGLRHICPMETRKAMKAFINDDVNMILISEGDVSGLKDIRLVLGILNGSERQVVVDGEEF
ncbi:hypothetical protein Ddye_012646 [Dipteronia dyeriana]|uniref:Uncharacterized protein n=1 Tax=Dipteronia dyeriana TaxID=168575 RepID=A0AAD9X4U3_9ROSI|nr:hypothetical protein Ddye_012646 [Dipteronia dyeriana]